MLVNSEWGKERLHDCVLQGQLALVYSCNMTISRQATYIGTDQMAAGCRDHNKSMYTNACGVVLRTHSACLCMHDNLYMVLLYAYYTVMSYLSNGRSFCAC